MVEVENSLSQRTVDKVRVNRSETTFPLGFVVAVLRVLLSQGCSFGRLSRSDQVVPQGRLTVRDRES
jgi:hypothetical protein